MGQFGTVTTGIDTSQFITKVTGATGNLGTFNVGGGLDDSGVKLSGITGGSASYSQYEIYVDGVNGFSGVPAPDGSFDKPFQSLEDAINYRNTIPAIPVKFIIMPYSGQTYNATELNASASTEFSTYLHNDIQKRFTASYLNLPVNVSATLTLNGSHTGDISFVGPSYWGLNSSISIINNFYIGDGAQIVMVDGNCKNSLVAENAFIETSSIYCPNVRAHNTEFKDTLTMSGGSEGNIQLTDCWMEDGTVIGKEISISGMRGSTQTGSIIYGELEVSVLNGGNIGVNSSQISIFRIDKGDTSNGNKVNINSVEATNTFYLKSNTGSIQIDGKGLQSNVNIGPSASGTMTLYFWSSGGLTFTATNSFGTTIIMYALNSGWENFSDTSFNGVFTTNFYDAPWSRRYYFGSSAPGASNDITDGFLVGSRFIDTTGDNEYVCLDNTATSAVWKVTT